MDYRFGKEVSEEFIKEKLNWNSKHFIKTAKKYAKLSTFKQKNCYVCSGRKTNLVSSFYGINYLMCQNCNHVYADKRLSAIGLKKYYSEDVSYFSEVYTKKSILKLREKIFIPKIRYVKKFAKGKNWLDVGSGDGTAVYVIRSEGFKGSGIELSKTGRDFARKYRNLKLYDKPLDNFILENKTKWDIISFFGVLEHIPDLTNNLKLSNRLLKKNGLVVAELPNYNSLSTYIQKLSLLPDRHLIPYAHIMMFTMKSAKYILQKTGFKPIAIWFWGMDMIELLKYIRNNDRKFTNSELIDLLSTKLNSLQFVFDNAMMGDQFLIIGRKVKSV